MNRFQFSETYSPYFGPSFHERFSVILQTPITVVEAPMGYGKTTAVRRFLEEQEVNSVWISLIDEQEEDLYPLLCNALVEVYPQHADIVAEMLAIGLDADRTDLRRINEMFLSINFNRPLVLVLDDYHLVNTRAVNHFFELIAQFIHADIHWVLIMRDAYLGNSDFLTLKGYMSVIGVDNFIFSRNDIEKLFAINRITLKQGEVEALFESTEGWVSALYFYLLRFQKEGTLLLPTSIFALIDQGIYSPLSTRVKNFLLSVCPLNEFTFEQAEYVWGDEDTGELLQLLRSENPFLRYSDRRGSFRFHGLFAAFLERRMQRLPVDRRGVLCTRCGDWFRHSGDLFSAIRYYYRGQNYEQALCAVEENCGRNIAIGEWDFFCELMADCPREIIDRHPWAVFFIAYCGFLIGDLETFADLQGILAEIAPQGETRSELTGMLAALRALEAHNNFIQMVEEFSIAFENLDGHLGFLSNSPWIWTMGAPSVLMLYHRRVGELESEISEMQAGMHNFDRLANGHGLGIEYLMQGEAELFAGRVDLAKVHAFSAEEMTMQENLVSNAGCVKFLLMRCAVLESDGAAYQKLWDDLRRVADADLYPERLVQTSLDLCHAFFSLHFGNPEEMAAWIRDGKRDELYMFPHGMYYTVAMHYLLLKENYAQLIGLSHVLDRDPNYKQYALFRIYSAIFGAVAQHRMGWGGKAVSALREALDIALPDRLYLPFAEHRIILSPILEELTAEEHIKAVTEINALADRWERGLKIIRRNEEQKSILTQREMEIARLADKGYSNGEIADSLFLAASTVKRSMVDIFRKLGINARKDLSRYRQFFAE